MAWSCLTHKFNMAHKLPSGSLADFAETTSGVFLLLSQFLSDLISDSLHATKVMVLSPLAQTGP